MLKSGWKRYWIRKILLHSCQIIANSNFTKNRLVEEYGIPQSLVSVFHPFVNVRAIEEAARGMAAIEKPEGVKIILSVGRLVKRKGFDMVIAAMNRLKDKPYEYWIIGEGDDKARLTRLIQEYELQEKVKLLGNVPNPEIYRYFKACDVFIMPSREIDGDVEGFGIVFLEAGVFRKPVIGGRSGGVPEAVVDGVTGLLVEPENVEEIAKALARLLADEMLRKKLGEGGYERVKREFSIA